MVQAGKKQTRLNVTRHVARLHKKIVVYARPRARVCACAYTHCTVGAMNCMRASVGSGVRGGAGGQWWTGLSIDAVIGS